MKLTLTCDSHSLRSFKQCPARFDFVHERKIEPIEHNEKFDIGTAVHELMRVYYGLKKEKGEITPVELSQINELILQPTTYLTQDQKDFLEVRFLRYHKHYKNDSYVTVAVETGFSKILYEDDNYLFIYEGRPDWVFRLNDNVDSILGVADHKSQSRHYDHYFYNDQALGYCWAAGTQLFTYNYFGLQETGTPDSWFRRSKKIFQPQEIGEWHKTTIEWYFKIARILEEAVFFGNKSQWDKSWQCQNGWGICEFARICEAPSIMKEDVINRFYQISTHKAW